MNATSAMNLTLLLDYETCKSAPGFFSLLALVLRKAGADVVLLSDGKENDSALLNLGVAFNQYLPLDPKHGKSYNALKLAHAKQCTEKGSPVIWVDRDFDTWTEGDVSKIPFLTVLNWVEVARSGPRGQKPGQA